MLSACLRLSTSTSKFLFMFFWTFFAVALVDITFSIRKGENLSRQASSKDLMTMNLGKFAASPSKFDCNRFCLFIYLFFIWRHHRCSIFFAGPVLPHPPQSPTCVGNVSRGEIEQLLISGSQHWSNSYPFKAIDLQPPPSSI